MSNSNTQSGGIGFMGVLAIVFITLKLTDVIDWSWWLVLMPIYGPISLVLVGVMIWAAISVAKGK